MKTLVKYSLAFMLCLLCSCEHSGSFSDRPHTRLYYEDQKKNKEIWVDNHHAQIIIIDSCEYIKSYTAAGGNTYTHKGNCKHCRKQLLKDIEYIIEKINKNR